MHKVYSKSQYFYLYYVPSQERIDRPKIKQDTIADSNSILK